MKASEKPDYMREETEEEAALVDRQIEAALRSAPPPSRKELMKRQRRWAELRSRLEKRFHEDPDSWSEYEELQHSLAYTASEMHEINKQVKKKGREEKKLAERISYLYDTTGLLLRMVSDLSTGDYDSENFRKIMHFESSTGLGLSTTYIRKGLRVDPFLSGLGFLYDPSKLVTAAAFKRDAYTGAGESDYARNYDRNTEKYKRVFTDTEGVEHRVTDFSRYPTSELKGKTWKAKFPPHTLAALTYKASQMRQFAPSTPKEFKAYTEIIVKPKPDKRLADAIVGVVFVKGIQQKTDDTPFDDNLDIGYVVRAIRTYLGKPLPLFEYDTLHLTYEPLERFNYWFDFPSIPIVTDMTRKQYKTLHAQNVALSHLVQNDFAVAFVRNYTDGGLDTLGTRLMFFAHKFHALPSTFMDDYGFSKMVRTELALQALAGFIAAESYLGISYDTQSALPDLTRMSAETITYVLHGVVYVVPTSRIRVRLPPVSIPSSPGNWSRTLAWFGVRGGCDGLANLLSQWECLGAGYLRGDLAPTADMLYLLASENPMKSEWLLGLF